MKKVLTFALVTLIVASIPFQQAEANCYAHGDGIYQEIIVNVEYERYYLYGANVYEAQDQYNRLVNELCAQNPGLTSWAQLGYRALGGGTNCDNNVVSGTGWEFINCR